MAPRSITINAAKVNTESKHTVHHRVEYYLYYRKGNRVIMPKDTPGKHVTGVCFSKLLSYCRGEHKPNRVLYVMEDDIHNTRLTLKEKKDFVKLSRKHKLLPSYFKYDWVGEDVSRIVINLDGVSPSLLYGYLCNFRYIREDPGFVRALVYLVKTKKMNFYAAYVLASKVCLSHGGHTVIDYVRYYMEECDPHKTRIPICMMVSLYRFFQSPNKYDTSTVLKGRDSFDCCNLIKSACEIALSWHIKAEQAIDKRLEVLVKMEKDEEILRLTKEVGGKNVR